MSPETSISPIDRPAPKPIKLTPGLGAVLQWAVNQVNAARAEALAAQAKLTAMEQLHIPLVKALVLDAGCRVEDFANYGIWQGEGSGPDDEQGVYYLKAR